MNHVIAAARGRRFKSPLSKAHTNKRAGQIREEFLRSKPAVVRARKLHRKRDVYLWQFAACFVPSMLFIITVILGQLNS